MGVYLVHTAIFEFIMLACFGISWPFSVYKSWKSRSCSGKSVIFLWLVFIGYLSGIVHKVVVNPNWVIWLYMINSVLVFADIVLYYRNQHLERQTN